MRKLELLAPAGSMESLTAALRCGCDAVYVGGRAFSARQNAANFDYTELGRAVRYCHLYGGKLYLAVNTIIFDSQTAGFSEHIKRALELGVDAFIVQDWGAADIIRSISPQARLHASTQMTVHSKEGVLAAKSMGFKRVVLSRELSQDVIKEVSSLGVETEMFVHGALCMSVSGQCFMSAMIGQRSANRGLCAQPCRLPFSAEGRGDRHALSLKDLSLAERIAEVAGTGVTSLKIEGRMKRPEYVAAAVTAFRNAIDGRPCDMDTLRAVFSRSGFTDGYFTGKRTNMFGIRDKEDSALSKEVFPKLHELYRAERKVSEVRFKADVSEGKPIRLEASDSEGNSAEVFGSVPEKAENRPLGAQLLERQLSKLGDTVFSFGGTESVIGDGLSVSSGELNSLRRKAVSALEEERIKSNTPVYAISDELPTLRGSSPDRVRVRVRIYSAELLENALEADEVIMPMDIIPENADDRIIAEPPRFIVDERAVEKRLCELRESGVNRLMCNNIAYIGLGKRLGFTLHGDFGLNAANSFSANSLAAMGLCDITLSPELKSGQISAIKSPVPAGIIGYGRLPLMLTRNCPVKNELGCKKCRHTLTDRTGRSFPVACHGGYTEVLNSQPIYLADRLSEFRGISFMTLYLTDESPESLGKLIRSYRFGGDKQENITRGLYFRGVL